MDVALFFALPAGTGRGAWTDNSLSSSLLFLCFLPLRLVHAGDGRGSLILLLLLVSLSPSTPLPSYASNKTKKTTVLLKFSKWRLQTSLGFGGGGVLAPLNRTRSGPKGVEAHLRPKPKESSKKKTNTHT